MSKNMACLEALLHFKCPDSVSKQYVGIDLIATTNYVDFECDVASNTFLLGQVRAHGTHSIAIHSRLKLKFCACCGAHAQNRSNNLSKPCKRKASHAGKEALRLIYKGKSPSTYL